MSTDLFGLMCDLVRADVARMSGERAAARMVGSEAPAEYQANRALSCLLCGEVVAISQAEDEHVCPTA